MLIRRQWRRGTTAALQGEILLQGEPGYDTDTKEAKVGDGQTVWEELPALGTTQDVAATFDASAIVSGTLNPARLPDLSGTYVPKDANGKVALSNLPDLSTLYAPLVGGKIPVTYLPDFGGTYVDQTDLFDANGYVQIGLIPDLASRYDPVGSADAVQANLDGLAQEVPTNEELIFVWFSGAAYGTMDVAPNYVIMAAPMDMRINSISMVWDDSNAWSGQPGSDTSWYQVAFTANGVTMVYQTTQLSGPDAGGGIVPNTDWNFDARIWSNQNLNKGQVLKLAFSRGATGTNAKPTNISQEFAVAIRYQRQVP